MANLDDRYVIHAAKTRLCGSYGLGNVEEILSFFADAFTDLSEGQPTLAHIDAKTVLKARLEKLLRENAVELSPIIIEVKLADGMAVDVWLACDDAAPKVGRTYRDKANAIHRNLGARPGPGVADRGLYRQ